MKKTFILMLGLLMTAFAAQAQRPSMPYNEKDKAIVYQEVVELPGMTKDQIFDRVYAWMNEAYERVDTKIYEKDKAAGKISLKGVTRLYLKDKKGNVTTVPDNVNYKLTIEAKDGKLRYTFYELHLPRGSHRLTLEEYYNKNLPDASADENQILTQAHDDITKLIASLKARMAGDPVKEEDKW